MHVYVLLMFLDFSWCSQDFSSFFSNISMLSFEYSGLVVRAIETTLYKYQRL